MECAKKLEIRPDHAGGAFAVGRRGTWPLSLDPGCGASLLDVEFRGLFT
jgi:hypothetical protein